MGIVRCSAECSAGRHQRSPHPSMTHQLHGLLRLSAKTRRGAPERARAGKGL